MKNEMKKALDELVDHLFSCEFFLGDAVRVVETAMIGQAMVRSGGNRSEASKLLGIHRNTLQAKLAANESARIPRKPPQRAKPVRRAKAR